MANESPCRRGTWGGRYEFILSTVGLAVGIANIWRLPFKAYENGGAAFFLAYCILLVVIGIPVFLMELAMGQYAGMGAVCVWRAVPLFKGIGWAMLLITGMLSVYYAMIIAYSVFYLFASFTSELPWQSCRSDQLSELGTCTDDMDAARHYWEQIVLDQSSGIEEGTVYLRWQLALCLLFVWALVFIFIIKGIRSSGKVVYVTVTLPYIILVVLLVRNSLLEGAGDGLKYLTEPDWEKLKESKVWYEAATQLFFSLSLATGALFTLASYNNYNNNVLRDTLVVVILDTLTSVLAALTVFTMIGHLAHARGVEVDAILEGSGPGLVFVVISEAVTHLPAPPLWNALFFFMLFLVGVDSLFNQVQAIITAIIDEFRAVRTWSFAQYLVRAIVCIALFSAGVPLCSKAGIFILHLMDSYIPYYATLGIAFLEIIAISWVYGFKRFSTNVSSMLGHISAFDNCLCPFWWPMWVIITPAAIAFTLVWGIVHYEPLTFGRGDDEIDYPDWADHLGFILISVPFSFVVICALKACCQASYSDKTLVSPSAEWFRRQEECAFGEDLAPVRKTDVVSNKPGLVARLIDKRRRRTNRCKAPCPVHARPDCVRRPQRPNPVSTNDHLRATTYNYPDPVPQPTIEPPVSCNSGNYGAYSGAFTGATSWGCAQNTLTTSNNDYNSLTRPTVVEGYVTAVNCT